MHKTRANKHRLSFVGACTPLCQQVCQTFAIFNGIALDPRPTMSMCDQRVRTYTGDRSLSRHVLKALMRLPLRWGPCMENAC